MGRGRKVFAYPFLQNRSSLGHMNQFSIPKQPKSPTSSAQIFLTKLIERFLNTCYSPFSSSIMMRSLVYRQIWPAISKLFSAISRADISVLSMSARAAARA